MSTMQQHHGLARWGRKVQVLFCAALAVSALALPAAPFISSTVPLNMATGVSPTAALVFTFSEPMNPAATTALFMDTSTSQFLTTFSTSWSAGNTVLTYSPTSPLPANHMIYWAVTGSNPIGAALTGTTFGLFTPGVPGTGCDRSAPMLSLTVSKGWMYAQNSAGAPVLNAGSPYCFLACLSLPCPRDATNVSLQVPTGATPNLILSPIPGHLTLPDCGYPSPSALDAAYPNSDYVFKIQAVSSNQQVTVNFAATLSQPPAPHLVNYLAGQSIDASQPFVVSWDPMAGGTTADCIYVEIYGGAFKTPALGEAGALKGTATSVTIPAGALLPNRQYSGCVTFYHYSLVTNSASHVALTYRASTTEFDLNTTAGGPASPLIITNTAWAGPAGFSFEVACSNGQALVVECSSTLLTNQWQTWCSTNSISQRVRFTDSRALTNKHLYYRVRNGP